MFVVVPFISSDPTTYGIYSVCISVTIFISYADLGFLGAAQKYAAETLAQNNRRHEMELIGFAHFILLIFILLLSATFLALSFNPHWLIKGIQAGAQTDIAHKLLLILAIFAPVTVIQRALQLIFGIRLQEYKLQQINILGSVLKILSVFYFFTGGRYDIVGYFLFLQLITLSVALAGVWLAKRNYQYDFRKLLSTLRFNKDIFRQTRSLAFASLFATLSWVLYYELDSVVIGRVLGAEQVAIYAIGLTMLGFTRSILGVFFSPFSARFNHFVGAGQQMELHRFYRHVMLILFPVVVFPLVAASIMANGLVISWVGEQYSASVEITQWLLLCNVLGFISYPTGIMLVAKNRIKQMNAVAIIIPCIFWGGIAATIAILGVESFAIFKFAAFVISGITYIWFMLHMLDISLWDFVRHNILPYLPALLIMVVILLLLQNVCVDGKNRLYLLYNALIVLLGIGMAVVVSLLTVKPFRTYVVNVTKLIIKR